MKRYMVFTGELREPYDDKPSDGPFVDVYLASEVDVRITQLQHAWQAELTANSKRGDTVSIGMCQPAVGVHALNCKCPPST